MIFNQLIGLEKIEEKDAKIRTREAVRAVIIQDDKILVIHSNLGDYKFPGGGVEPNESHEDGLVREVAEETGYIHCVVKEKIGVVVERHVDEYKLSDYFEMNSHYYLCELSDNVKIALQLEEYESDLEFRPKWVSIDDAIAQNQVVINSFKQNSWVKRENFVLKELKKLYSTC